MKAFVALVFIVSVCSSCSVFHRTAKKQFDDGFYTQHMDGKKQKVYIDVEEDVVRIHPTNAAGQILIDTNNVNYYWPEEKAERAKRPTTFSKGSFDIDFLTIPLKYRPAQAGVPSQLNANLSGAVYLGYRNDFYMLDYIKKPVGKSSRNIEHLGFSIGAFTGLGNTLLSSTTTNNKLQQDYDGIVWSKGVAGIIAVNNFTVGVALGFDNLLDKNDANWIYQHKPWMGLAFGLNLN